ncbi:uncharacterized protein BXZ73DRAFT_98007 [Epithele typhae]|uniref:uncharacterized protein n=1 Tax=Epithele typhae TaxID=378194 RepID=UPI002007B41D|nr:uncharacterized protein BXZ73DRAFT_98007 [Epithele typhae]KAH9941617.1 hypothetical protein BXZ73DRAFT_98007 [Epithele typhae]
MPRVEQKTDTPTQSRKSTKRKEQPVRDPTFYFEHVENTLFLVPRRPFITESKFFEDLLSQSSSDKTKPSPGSSDETPLVLANVAVEDFRSLLKQMVLLPYGTPNRKPMSNDEWIIADHLRSEKDIDFISWVLIARQFSVSHWLLLAYMGLIKRRKPLEEGDLETLGVSTFFGLMRFREERLSSYHDIQDDKCSNHFKEEFRALDEAAKLYYEPPTQLEGGSKRKVDADDDDDDNDSRRQSKRILH